LERSPQATNPTSGASRSSFSSAAGGKIGKVTAGDQSYLRSQPLLLFFRRRRQEWKGHRRRPILPQEPAAPPFLPPQAAKLERSPQATNPTSGASRAASRDYFAKRGCPSSVEPPTLDLL
jgi:hypothetical protein